MYDTNTESLQLHACYSTKEHHVYNYRVNHEPLQKPEVVTVYATEFRTLQLWEHDIPLDQYFYNYGITVCSNPLQLLGHCLECH